MAYVISSGSAFDGLTLWGPFESFGYAQEVALEKFDGEEWEIVECKEPEEEIEAEEPEREGAGAVDIGLLKSQASAISELIVPGGKYQEELEGVWNLLESMLDASERIPSNRLKIELSKSRE